MIPTHIRDLARAILACDLSTQHAFRNYPSDSLHLLDIADRILSDPSGNPRGNEVANDAIKTAFCVHKHLQAPLLTLVDVVWKEATESTAVPSTDWAKRLIGKVFVDDTPRYDRHPGRLSR